MKKSELLECMQELEFCLTDLQIESLILSLLENSPDIGRYDPDVVSNARSRTVGFIENYVSSFAAVYGRLGKALCLSSWPDAVEVDTAAG